MKSKRAVMILMLAACGPTSASGPGGANPSSGGDPYAGPSGGAPPSTSPYTAPAPVSAPPPPARGPALPADAQAFVDVHNADRAKHCAPPLTWSPQLASAAQAWADSLRAQGCKFGHSNGPTGENLAAGTSGTLDAKSVTAMWYDEISGYRFPDGGFSMTTGHFTQVVWKGTAQLGCGRSTCNGMDIFVCEYDAPGNVEGEYRANVLPLGCR